MRIPCTCPTCGGAVVVLLAENLMGEGVCPAGHRSRAFWIFDKHHALLDSAVLAFLSGFLFESVASLAAGLECFNRWYMRALWRKHLPWDTDRDHLWKVMSQQSERQLGALYVIQCRERGHILEVPKAEFRNKVIHKGYLPTAAEVLKYGTEVFDYVVTLRTEAYDHAEEWAADEMDESAPRPPDDLPLAGVNAPSSAMEGATFESALQHSRRLLGRLAGDVPFDGRRPGESLN